MSPAIKIFQPLLTKHFFDNLVFHAAFLWWNSKAISIYPKANLSVCIWNGLDLVEWGTQTWFSPTTSGRSQLWSRWWTVFPLFTGVSGSQIWVSVTWQLKGEDILTLVRNPCVSIPNLGTVLVMDVRVSCKGTSRACTRENSCHLFWPLVMVTMLPTPELQFWTMTSAWDINSCNMFWGYLLLLWFCYKMKICNSFVYLWKVKFSPLHVFVIC